MSADLDLIVVEDIRGLWRSRFDYGHARRSFEGDGPMDERHAALLRAAMTSSVPLSAPIHA